MHWLQAFKCEGDFLEDCKILQYASHWISRVSPGSSHLHSGGFRGLLKGRFFPTWRLALIAGSPSITFAVMQSACFKQTQHLHLLLDSTMGPPPCFMHRMSPSIFHKFSLGWATESQAARCLVFCYSALSIAQQGCG